MHCQTDGILSEWINLIAADHMLIKSLLALVLKLFYTFYFFSVASSLDVLLK